MVLKVEGRPRGYLDTCLVTGLAKEDLKPEEQAALVRLLEARKAGRIDLVTSHVTREEIECYRSDGRHLQKAIYSLLDDVPQAVEVRPSMIALLGVGGPRPDPLYVALGNVLHDADARHVFQAAKNGVDYFVTTDVRTIVSRAEQVRQIASVEVVLPSTLAAKLDEPGRTGGP